MERAIRLLHFSESSETGGAETVFLHLVTRLDASRYEPLVLLMKTGWLWDQLVARGIQPIRLPSKPGLDLSLPFRLRRFLARQKVNLVHAHLPDSNAYAALAALGTGRPVVATYHGLISSGGRSSWSERAKLQSVRLGAGRVVAVSDLLATQLVDRVGMRRALVTRIYNGVDWRSFDRAADPARLKAELGILPDEPIVGMVANLKPEKDYPCFVRAAARILKKLPRTRFLIAGTEEEPLRGALDLDMRRLGIRDRFQFLGYREDLPALLALLHVFVLSSISEGMSIATVEAMGAGTPVVVTRSGGPEELVEHEVTGLLVPTSNDEALALQVLNVLQNQEQAKRLGQAGRASARRRFELDDMIRQYEAVYQDVLTERGVSL